ncbi:hypothetical protein K493DRAFT_319403 [Basidiobolus meristosporus CBS 931.73]|uniref:Yeast cell wall synthesis Kre9/Knh1-like N-terminal domain-containing protein n=1 Tax=Basidiobolus meristosporus CBS 931.73 TaxID=1314790 RepID=A0A1Y1XRY2_9FUNG|nr:hypothetical protein K493DRAFT_319403 [Basidiobolus meristosporus CBS 931.73]|eukprot:ORX88521.1 hypothetical protein K493DRAFT_319403 [Basidiobolus meristosporus CBS 931.73]
MRFPVILTALVSTLGFALADFETITPTPNGRYVSGQTLKISWKDNGDGKLINDRTTFSIRLSNGPRVRLWHPVLEIANFTKPFPSSYNWKIPKNLKADRYFLVYTDNTRTQPKSDYFFVDGPKH